MPGLSTLLAFARQLERAGSVMWPARYAQRARPPALWEWSGASHGAGHRTLEPGADGARPRPRPCCRPGAGGRPDPGVVSTCSVVAQTRARRSWATSSRTSMPALLATCAYDSLLADGRLEHRPSASTSVRDAPPSSASSGSSTNACGQRTSHRAARPGLYSLPSQYGAIAGG